MSEQKITNITDAAVAEPASPDLAAAPRKTKRPVSEARLRANRENAKNSCGPRTDEGKRRSSLNATRHGILSQVIHLPEEDLAAYDEFTCTYVADLKPVGVVETPPMPAPTCCSGCIVSLPASTTCSPSVTKKTTMPGSRPPRSP